MALATQCPHCHTTFRVAHDQLKLRAGLVRCGACKQIFNGIENLLPADELEPAPDNTGVPAAPVTTPGTASATVETQSAPPLAPASEAASHAGTAPAASTEPEPASPAEQEAGDQASRPPDPLLRMTLVDIAHPAMPEPAANDADEANEGNEPAASPDKSGHADVGSADPLAKAIDDLQQKPWRSVETGSDDSESDALDQVDEREYVEPDFVRRGRRRERLGHVLRIAMASAVPLLLLLFLAQSAYSFRDRLAASFPSLRPGAAAACRALGCTVGLPTQIDYVSLESSELQTLSADKNTFELALLLLNQSATAEAWPDIELTLNDANEKPLVRRVFRPSDYLGSPQAVEQGFAARSEHPVKLYFTLTGVQASGYRAYLFYP